MLLGTLIMQKTLIIFALFLLANKLNTQIPIGKAIGGMVEETFHQVVALPRGAHVLADCTAFEGGDVKIKTFGIRTRSITPSSCMHSVEDSSYTHTVTIDSIVVKITCVSKADSFDLTIDIMSDKLTPIWVGVTSVNNFIMDNDVTTTILPDIDLHENILLVDIDKEHRLPIFNDKFAASGNYNFTFYLVNNWDKFIQCVNEKSDIETYENELGQTVCQIHHARVPENGISIISLSNISPTKNFVEFTYKVNNY